MPKLVDHLMFGVQPVLLEDVVDDGLPWDLAGTERAEFAQHAGVAPAGLRAIFTTSSRLSAGFRGRGVEQPAASLLRRCCLAATPRVDERLRAACYIGVRRARFPNSLRSEMFRLVDRLR